MTQLFRDRFAMRYMREGDTEWRYSANTYPANVRTATYCADPAFYRFARIQFTLGAFEYGASDEAFRDAAKRAFESCDDPIHEPQPADWPGYMAQPFDD